jgi:hypothetical protein
VTGHMRTLTQGVLTGTLSSTSDCLFERLDLGDKSLQRWDHGNEDREQGGVHRNCHETVDRLEYRLGLCLDFAPE